MDESKIEGIDAITCAGSSNVLGASYSIADETLKVHFGVDGKEYSMYTYTGYPPALWAEFKLATSKGGFVQNVIRRHFKGERYLFEEELDTLAQLQASLKQFNR